MTTDKGIFEMAIDTRIEAGARALAKQQVRGIQVINDAFAPNGDGALPLREVDVLWRDYEDQVRLVIEAISGGWISVKDKLPEPDKTVIVRFASGYDGAHVYAWGARCDDAEGWLWGIGGRWGVQPGADIAQNSIEADDDYTVTHWMSLPEPPNKL